MSDPRYLVMDESGMVVNTVVGFVDLPAVGFIEQTDELLHVGMFWVYDADADEFVNRYGSLPPGMVSDDVAEATL